MLSFIRYNSILAICQELLSIHYKWTAACVVVKNIPSILDGVFSSFSTTQLLQKNFFVFLWLIFAFCCVFVCKYLNKKKKSEQYLDFVFLLFVYYFRSKRVSRLYVFMLFPFDFTS